MPLSYLQRFRRRLHSVPGLLVLLLLALVFPLVLFPLAGVGDARLLDLFFSYSPEQAYRHLAGFTPDQLNGYYAMSLSSDMVFPLVYSLALSVAMTLLLRGITAAGSRWRWLAWLPFLVVPVDITENLLLSRIVLAFPIHNDTLVQWASTCTSLKWVLIAAMLVLLGVLAILRLVKARA